MDELAEVFRASGAKGAIVCASDATLDELGEDAVAALRTAGAVWVAAAGKKDLGADARVAEGDDILAFLDLAWNATGAPRR